MERKVSMKKSKTASQTYAKEVSASCKSFEIANSRGIPTRKILEYDILEIHSSIERITQRNQGNTN